MPLPTPQPAPKSVQALLTLVADYVGASVHTVVCAAQRDVLSAEARVRRVRLEVARDLAACPPTPQQRQSVRLRLERADRSLERLMDHLRIVETAQKNRNATAYAAALALLPAVEDSLRYAFGAAARSAMSSGAVLPEPWRGLQEARHHYQTVLDGLEAIRPEDVAPVIPHDCLTATPLPADLAPVGHPSHAT